MNRSLHVKSMNDIREITEYFFDSGEEYYEAMTEVAHQLPEDPFLEDEISELLGSTANEHFKECIFTIFAKGNHSEILPWIVQFSETTKNLDLQLTTAAAMAQIGDENGYQFIESVFQRYMKHEADMVEFDFESFVLIFKEILTNERGREMFERFCTEADYHDEWHTLEQPDVE